MCVGDIQEALSQICEYSEAGITVRGTYYPPNKEPKEGDRKLYLGIEATNELAIQKAKTEIIRLIKEELQRLVCAALYTSHLTSCSSRDSGRGRGRCGGRGRGHISSRRQLNLRLVLVFSSTGGSNIVCINQFVFLVLFLLISCVTVRVVN